MGNNKRIGMRKLGMATAHRMAMLRNMVTSLIYHERIMTTTPRAKELRRVAEKMVTHAKKANQHHRRLARAFVREEAAVVKLFGILGPRYEDRDGGYTRIMKLGKKRQGDSADMSYIEFVDREGEMRVSKPAQSPEKIAKLAAEAAEAAQKQLQAEATAKAVVDSVANAMSGGMLGGAKFDFRRSKELEQAALSKARLERKEKKKRLLDEAKKE